MEQEINASVLERSITLTKWPSVQPTMLPTSGTVSPSQWYLVMVLTCSVPSCPADCGRTLGCDFTSFDYLPPWPKPSGIPCTCNIVTCSCTAGFLDLSIRNQLTNFSSLLCWILLLGCGVTNTTPQDSRHGTHHRCKGGLDPSEQRQGWCIQMPKRDSVSVCHQ